MKKILFILLVSIFAFSNNVKANTIGIVAIVNDDIITSYDFYNRINMTVANMGIEPTQENIQKISATALQELIFETLKIQSGEKLGFSVSKEDLDSALAGIASQNNMDLNGLKEELNKGNINISTLEHQIKATILWNQYISKKIAPTITISEEEINDEFQKVKSDSKKTQYLIEQITIPKKESYSYELITSLLSESRDNENFEEVAKSISPNYKTWVLLDSIPDALSNTIKNLDINEVSDIIETDQFFSVVKLIDTRKGSNILNDNIKEQIRKSLAMQQIDIYEKRELKDLRDISFIEIKMAQ